MLRHTGTEVPGVVTPLAGVWIEISNYKNIRLLCLSLPLRECGLKCNLEEFMDIDKKVTPLAGVWIEIFYFEFLSPF